MLIRVFKWLIFSVLISLFPFVLNALILRNHGSQPNGFGGIALFWEHGELLLISVTLIATGIGDVVSSSGEFKSFKIVSVSAAVVLLLVAVGWYTEISSCVVRNELYDKSFVKDWTPWLFVCSLTVSLACVLLSKEA